MEEEAAAGVRWSEQRQRSVQISPKEHLKDPAEGSLLGCFAPQKQEVWSEAATDAAAAAARSGWTIVMRLETRQRTRAADVAPVPAAVELIPDTKQPELRSHFPDSPWQTGILPQEVCPSRRVIHILMWTTEITAQIWVTWEGL